MELLTPVDFYHDSKSGLKPICMPTNPNYYYHMMGKSDWAGMASFGFVGEDPDIIKYPDSDAIEGWPSSLREISTQIWPQAFCKVVLNNAKKNKLFKCKICCKVFNRKGNCLTI